MNTVAFRNICRVLVTEAVLLPQPFNGELNAVAAWNMPVMFVTLATFHELRSPLNAWVLANMYCMFVSRVTFQLAISPSKAVAPLNIWTIDVTLAVFQRSPDVLRS